MKKLHTAEHEKQLDYEEIRDKVAVIYVVFSNIVATACIVVIAMISAINQQADLVTIFSRGFITGFICLFVFGYITAYVERRIVKKSKKRMR